LNWWSVWRDRRVGGADGGVCGSPKVGGRPSARMHVVEVDVPVLLSVHYAWIDPEEPLIANTVEQLTKVAAGPLTAAVYAQLSSENVDHRVAAVLVRAGASLRVGVYRASLFVPHQPVTAACFTLAVVG